MSVILIGFMGAGKSTVGRLLADDFVDLDRMIERQIEMPIGRFFELFGEEDFRQVESEVFESAVQMDFVIATGGGIVENPSNLEVLGFQTNVVYLRADFEVLWERILSDVENVRPLANDERAARALYERRCACYESVADVTIDVTNLDSVRVAQLIREKVLS